MTDGRAQKGLPLTAVNLLVLPVVVGCTSLVTALGVTALAAHTIVKQVPPRSPLDTSAAPQLLPGRPFIYMLRVKAYARSQALFLRENIRSVHIPIKSTAFRDPRYIVLQISLMLPVMHNLRVQLVDM